MISYTDALLGYCTNHDEESLYLASLLSAQYISEGLGPDDIVGLHFDAVQEVASLDTFSVPERIRVLNDAHQFLLEVMIGYGAQYKEYLDLRLQEAVRRAETAERSEQEKLEVLAMIAHELGNPLTVALGNMQIAARYLDANDMSNIRSLVTDSREALDRLAHLTNQIVLASRGEDLQVELEPLDLLEPLLKMRNWTRADAQEKGLSIQIPDWTEPLMVLANKDAVESIIRNLLSNAIRYTPSGGQIVVAAGRDAENAVLSVTDTGIGMTPEEQAKIFDKFYRGSQAKEMEAKGLGMGLNIASRLAQSLNGRIEVTSEPGVGSTFSLVLPLTSQ